jgi:hypothetical protein
MNKNTLTNPTVEVETKKKVEPVISYIPSEGKKSGWSSFFGGFFKKDIPQVATYVVKDILVPAFKDTVAKMIKNSIDMMLFGETRSSGSGKYYGLTNSYSAYYQERDILPMGPVRSVSEGEVRYLPLRSEEDVKKVLYSLRECFERYGQISKGDYYDAVKVRAEFTDYNWGWRTLRGIDYIEEAPDRWVIIFPRAEQIKR